MSASFHPIDHSHEYYFQEGCHILELLNTPDDPALSIARARVAPGEITRWHRLRDTTERYVIQHGQGSVDAGELRGQPVGPGDMVCIAAGEDQRIRNTGDEDLVFLAICTPRFRAENYEDREAERTGTDVAGT